MVNNNILALKEINTYRDVRVRSISPIKRKNLNKDILNDINSDTNPTFSEQHTLENRGNINMKKSSTSLHSEIVQVKSKKYSFPDSEFAGSHDNSTKFYSSHNNHNFLHSDNKLILNNKPRKDEFIKGKLLGNGRFASTYSGLSGFTGESVVIKTYKTYDKFKVLHPLLRQQLEQQLIEGVHRLKSINHKNLINCIETDSETDVSISKEVKDGKTYKNL
jgi:hypothetical protein